MVELILQFVINLRDPMDQNIHTTVDVTVGDALGSFIQFLQSFGFELLTGCLFGYLLQHPLDVCGGILVYFALVVGVILSGTAHRSGNRVRLVEWNPTAFLCDRFLLFRSTAGSLQWSANIIRYGGIVRVRTRCRIFFRAVVPRLVFLFSRCPRLIWFFAIIPRPVLADQGLRAAAGCSVCRNPSPCPRTGNRSAGTGAFCTGSGNNLKQAGQNFTSRASGTGGGCFVLTLLAKLNVVLNVMPATDQDKTDDFPALLCESGGDSRIQLRYQLEYCLDTFIAQGRFVILDLTVQGIGE